VVLNSQILAVFLVVCLAVHSARHRLSETRKKWVGTTLARVAQTKNTKSAVFLETRIRTLKETEKALNGLFCFGGMV